MFDFLIRGFEIRNSNLLKFESWLSKRHNYSNLCSPHPFKVISHDTNPLRLLCIYYYYCIYLLLL